LTGIIAIEEEISEKSSPALNSKRFSFKRHLEQSQATSRDQSFYSKHSSEYKSERRSIDEIKPTEEKQG